MPTETPRGSTGVSAYVRDIRQYQHLSREGESALLGRGRYREAGAPDQRELVESNLAFVVKIANEYRNMGLPLEDLVGEGTVGMLEAARHFDPARGNRFLTYAVWWIRKSMLGALARQGSVVHVPAYQVQKLRTLTRERRKVSAALGREAGREEISREMMLPIEAVDRILLARSRDLSLDAPADREGKHPIADLLIDERSAPPDERLIHDENRALVRWALGRLSRQERSIIVRRYGLRGGAGLTLREMGERMGLSRERIRQVETRAMQRLRKAIIRRSRASLPARALSRRAALPV